MSEILHHTGYNHEHDDGHHCCGCFDIIRLDDGYGIKCNECGEVRSLMPIFEALTPTKDSALSNTERFTAEVTYSKSVSMHLGMVNITSDNPNALEEALAMLPPNNREGIDLRSHFAMAALTGMLVDKYQCDGTIQGYAERAYAFADAFADALLEARKK